MKLIIVSGRSGSGKSTALHVLEDLGFYCIDNLPIGLLFPLTQEATNQNSPSRLGKMAVSIDAGALSGRCRASGVPERCALTDTSGAGGTTPSRSNPKVVSI